LKGGTLFVSRAYKLFPFYIPKIAALGFADVQATSEEKDALNMLINEIKPYFLIIDSDFYSIATPYMMGRLLKAFPKLYVAAVSFDNYPDDKAAWFIWHGVRSYVKWYDGEKEFKDALKGICGGKDFISPDVQKLLDQYPEWPEVSLKITENQKEVLLMLYNAFTLEEIQDNLQICKSTVDYYIRKLATAFHAKSREEIIKIASYLDIVTKKDLHFKGRTNFKLPKWAALQRAMSSEQIKMNNEKRAIRRGVW